LLQQHLIIVRTLLKLTFHQPSNNRHDHSSLFGFGDNLTITSYVPAIAKAVLTLPNMYHNSTTAGESQKPTIMLHYSATKSGIYNMDRLATLLSCNRKSNRWPLVLFYNMLNMVGVAGFVVWVSLNSR